MNVQVAVFGGGYAMRLLMMFCLTFLASQSVLANEQPLAFDGPLAAALSAASSSPGIDVDEAVQIVAVLNSMSRSEGFSSNEQALLTKLASAKAPFTVSIAGKPIQIGPLLPEAAQLMALAYSNPPQPLALWQRGDSSIILNMTRLSTVNLRFHNQLMAIVTADLRAAWQNSTVGNGYAPLRDKLAALSKIYDNTNPTLRRTGRDLLVKAMKRLDDIASNSVPDFLYGWLTD